MSKRLLLLALLFGCFGVQLTSSAVTKKAPAKRSVVAKKQQAKKSVAKKGTKKPVAKKAATKKVAKKPAVKKQEKPNPALFLACVIDCERSANKLLQVARKIAPNNPNIMLLQMFIEGLRELRLQMYAHH